MDLAVFALLFQMYEVAVSAQNAERVKLETFDGSLGYLHNGLYRDPKLPGILKWGNISLLLLSQCAACFILTTHVSLRASPAGSLCTLCNFGTTEERETLSDFRYSAPISFGQPLCSDGLSFWISDFCEAKMFVIVFRFCGIFISLSEQEIPAPSGKAI